MIVVLGFNSKKVIRNNMKKLLKLLKVLCLVQFFTGCFESKEINEKTVSSLSSSNEQYLKLKLENLIKEFEEERSNPSSNRKAMEEDIDDFFDSFYPAYNRVKDNLFKEFREMESSSTRRDFFERDYNLFLEDLNKAEETYNGMMSLNNSMKDKILLREKEVALLSKKIEEINTELREVGESIKEIDKFISSEESNVDDHLREIDNKTNKSVNTINSLVKEYNDHLKEVEDRINGDMVNKIGNDEGLQGIPDIDSKGQNKREGGYMTELFTRLQEFRNGGYDSSGNFVAPIDANKNGIVDRAHDGSDSLANLIETDAKMKNREEANAGLDQVTKTLDTMIMASEEKIKEIDRKIDKASVEYAAYKTEYDLVGVNFNNDAIAYLPGTLVPDSKGKISVPGHHVYDEFESVRKEIEDTGRRDFDTEFDKFLKSWKDRLESSMTGDSTFPTKISDADSFFNIDITGSTGKFEGIAEGNEKISMSLRHLVEKSAHLGDDKLEETMKNIALLIKEAADEIKKNDEETIRLCSTPKEVVTQIVTDAGFDQLIIDNAAIDKDNFYKVAEKAKFDSDQRKIRDACKVEVNRINGLILTAVNKRTELEDELKDANTKVGLPEKIKNDTVALENLNTKLITDNEFLKTKENELADKQQDKGDKTDEFNSTVDPLKKADIQLEIDSIDSDIANLNLEIIAAETDVADDENGINGLRVSLAKDKKDSSEADKRRQTHPDLIQGKTEEIDKLVAELAIANEALRQAQCNLNFRIGIENELCQKKINHQNAILKKFKGEGVKFRQGMLGSKINTLKEALILAKQAREKNAKKHGFTLDTTVIDKYTSDIHKYLRNKSDNLSFGVGANDFPVIQADRFCTLDDSKGLPPNDAFYKSATPVERKLLAEKGLGHKTFDEGNYRAKLEYEKSILMRKKEDYELWKSELKLFKVQQNENPTDLENGLHVFLNYETWQQQKDVTSYLSAPSDGNSSTFDEQAGHLTAINGIMIGSYNADFKKVDDSTNILKYFSNKLLTLVDPTITDHSFNMIDPANINNSGIWDDILNNVYCYEFGYNYLSRSGTNGEIYRKTHPSQMYAQEFSSLEVLDPKKGIEVEAY